MSHHYEIEYSLIGSLLKGGLTPQARDVMTWLEPEMFATFQLGATYANIRKQSRKDNLIDLVLLNQDFGEDLSMLAEISKNTFSASNLSGYAEKVRNNWIIRTAQKTLLETANKFSVAKDNELESITTSALSQLGRLLADRTKLKPVAMGELLDGYIEVLDTRLKPDFGERLLKTGIEAVDNIIGGINPTDITVIAGRPAMGKTEFVLTIAKNIVANNGSVLFFSLEMDNYQLIDRILSAGGGVAVKKLRNPSEMSDTDFNKMGACISEMRERKMYFVDRGGLSAQEIISITENHLSQTGKLSAIVIDYLGLMNHGNGKENLTQKIGDTLNQLKTFAKNYKVPVILLSQLNREVDGRTNKRPMSSDLRDSGSIEQDASQIIMLYREKAYKHDSDNNYSEAIVTKNRFGETGTAYMLFDKGHFIDCDQQLAAECAHRKTTQETKRYGVN